MGGVPPTPSEKDVRMWSMLCHLTALCQLVVPIPSLGAVAGPLVVWLLKRNDHPTIDANGKESLNFQISMLIYTWALGVVGFATVFILIGFLFLALAFVVWLVALIYAVIAAVKASGGETYHYPFTIRFIN
jgi:uncharacterized Tic20 family protein